MRLKARNDDQIYYILLNSLLVNPKSKQACTHATKCQRQVNVLMKLRIGNKSVMLHCHLAASSDKCRILRCSSFESQVWPKDKRILTDEVDMPDVMLSPKPPMVISTLPCQQKVWISLITINDISICFWLKNKIHQSHWADENILFNNHFSFPQWSAINTAQHTESNYSNYHPTVEVRRRLTCTRVATDFSTVSFWIQYTLWDMEDRLSPENILTNANLPSLCLIRSPHAPRTHFNQSRLTRKQKDRNGKERVQ